MDDPVRRHGPEWGQIPAQRQFQVVALFEDGFRRLPRVVRIEPVAILRHRSQRYPRLAKHQIAALGAFLTGFIEVHPMDHLCRTRLASGLGRRREQKSLHGPVSFFGPRGEADPQIPHRVPADLLRIQAGANLLYFREYSLQSHASILYSGFVYSTLGVSLSPQKFLRATT
jgi:hypothetical protein